MRLTSARDAGHDDPERASRECPVPLFCDERRSWRHRQFARCASHKGRAAYPRGTDDSFFAPSWYWTRGRASVAVDFLVRRRSRCSQAGRGQVILAKTSRVPAR